LSGVASRAALPARPAWVHPCIQAPREQGRFSRDGATQLFRQIV